MSKHLEYCFAPRIRHCEAVRMLLCNEQLNSKVRYTMKKCQSNLLTSLERVIALQY